MSQNDLEQPLRPSEGQDTSSLQDERSGDESASSDRSTAVEAPDAAKAPVDLDSESAEASEARSATEPSRDSYLDDDEEWLHAADEILHKDETSVIAQQEDAVVSWDIQGLYDDSGKVRGKRSLRNNPPMFVVSDSSGDSATFVLTKELSGVLARHMDNAHRAFYGIRPKDELSFKEKLSDARTGLRENMGKAIVVGGLLVALLIFGFIL